MTETDNALLDPQAAWSDLSPERLEVERARVGQEMSQGRPFVEVATRDAIRHWAEGTGDRNRLYLGPAYAAGTRWGGVVGPPTMVMAMNQNIISTAARGFGGWHSWHLGTTFTWSRAIREGDQFTGISVLEDLIETESRYAGGRTYDQIVRTDLVDAAGEAVVVTRTHLRRFDRRAGQKSTKYARREKHVYRDEQIGEIAEAYAREVRELRGAEPRYVQDVSAGDELPTIIRGPLTTADCVAFAMGWGGSFIRAHGFAWEFMNAKPSAFPRNDSNIPDSPERTHYVDEFARAIGAPAAFDYGPQRIAWAATAVTNWIGDDGRLAGLDVRILRPNYHGDLVTVSGKVSAVDTAAGTAEIEVQLINQIDDLVADARATVELPSRSQG